MGRYHPTSSGEVRQQWDALYRPVNLKSSSSGQDDGGGSVMAEERRAGRLWQSSRDVSVGRGDLGRLETRQLEV